MMRLRRSQKKRTPESSIEAPNAGKNESETLPHVPTAAYTRETAALPSEVTANTRAKG